MLQIGPAPPMKPEHTATAATAHTACWLASGWLSLSGTRDLAGRGGAGVISLQATAPRPVDCADQPNLVRPHAGRPRAVRCPLIVQAVGPIHHRPSYDAAGRGGAGPSAPSALIAPVGFAFRACSGQTMRGLARPVLPPAVRATTPRHATRRDAMRQIRHWPAFNWPSAVRRGVTPLCCPATPRAWRASRWACPT